MRSDWIYLVRLARTSDNLNTHCVYVTDGFVQSLKRERKITQRNTESAFCFRFYFGLEFFQSDVPFYGQNFSAATP